MNEQEALIRIRNLAMRAPNPTDAETDALMLLEKSIKENDIMASTNKIEQLSHALAEARKLLGRNFERRELDPE